VDELASGSNFVSPMQSKSAHAQKACSMDIGAKRPAGSPKNKPV
jgi:hypothetical protein